MPVPYKYAKHGTSGLEISELLPRLSAHADDLCVLRSLHTDNPNHGPALFMMNNGTIAPLRPSMGSWMLYGLGSENENLPGYVALCPGRPVRFAELWTNSFLPARYQGTYVNHADLTPEKMLPFLKNPQLDTAAQREQLSLLQTLNAEHLADRVGEGALEGRIQALETAFRMQFAAGDAFDLARNMEPATFPTAVCWPGGWSSGVCGWCRCTTATGNLGTPTATTTSRRASCVPTSTVRWPRC
jgi:hypothetical protein